MRMRLGDQNIRWVSFVLALIILAAVVPRLGAQTACAVRVDLRWFMMPNTVVRGPDGTVLKPTQVQMANDFIQQPVGEIYWRETAKKQYPDICLDKEHADYFVFWTQSGDMTGVSVSPRRDSGCAVPKLVFETEKFNNDKERSAKQAFKETLESLRRQGRGDYLSIPGCIPPESFNQISDTVPPTQTAQPQPEPPPKPTLPSDGSPQSVLDISSTPSGADIELDGSFTGNTPSSMAIPAGEHALIIAKKGYRRWERKINALAGRISIAAELEPDTKPSKPPQ
jgi:hypothetical protein